jgi:hypothetical protein
LTKDVNDMSIRRRDVFACQREETGVGGVAFEVGLICAGGVKRCRRQ